MKSTIEVLMKIESTYYGGSVKEGDNCSPPRWRPAIFMGYGRNPLMCTVQLVSDDENERKCRYYCMLCRPRDGKKQLKDYNLKLETVFQNKPDDYECPVIETLGMFFEMAGALAACVAAETLVSLIVDAATGEDTDWVKFLLSVGGDKGEDDIVADGDESNNILYSFIKYCCGWMCKDDGSTSCKCSCPCACEDCN